ncbi:NACHT domain-containing protein [Streptomyces sp. NPDC094038]|uniref:NACHT domain-containing protein n=1 Tax=Streptomyces sp. NPDC094038 TaxID=3366055 RepID=UPI0038126056
MDPAVLGTKLASSLVAPLVKRLFVRDAAGAGLVERPVRVSALVSFRGEKRTLSEPDVHKIAGVLVREALRSPGERPFPADEETAVTDALARTLLALGTLDMDDVQAVRLGHGELARELLRRAPAEELSADAEYFLRSAAEWACVHVIDFFTRRSSFVARTLVEQVRGQAELISRVDELIARTPRQDGRDSAFERRYLAYIAKKHSKLFIYGIDLINSPGRWPLDAAYLSLQATAPSGLAEEIVYFDTARRNAERTLIAAENALRQAATTGLSQAARERAHQARATLEHAVHRTASLAALHQTSRIPLPADEALADHERIMLRGEAGSGKTTLIQWLAVSAARPTGDGGDSGRMTYLRDRIPFVLPLRSLTRHGGRLPAPRHFLDAVGAAIAGEQPAGWEARVLTAGRALVLVDGIDEVPEAERALARAWLVDLVDAYPGNRWLVTSRPSAVREDWLADAAFTELVLSPMRPEDVVSFVRRWHTAARPAAPGEDGDLDRYQAQLIHAVRTKPDLGRLATNPLMCGLICALHRDRRGFLPLGRKELYEAALTMLLARRDRERGMPSPELREEPQLQILQRLAYWLIKDGRTEMARERAVAEIDKALPALPEAAALGDADTVLAHLLNRSGLLRAPSTDTIDFCHRTFQDFLGARALLDEGTFGMVHKHAGDDQWEDVIRMAVAQGRPRDRGEILGELLRADSPRALLLAASCLEQATELDPSVRTAIENGVAGLVPPPDLESAYELAAVGPLILDFLPAPRQLASSGEETGAGDGAAEAAHLCVITASLIGTDTAIPYLAEFAGHPSWRVRKQLSGSWHRFDTEVYGREVIARLRHDDLYLVAHSAAELAAVRAMGGRPWMQLEGDFAPEDLAAQLDPGQLTRLDLRGTVRDLSVLARFPRLGTLYVTECPPEVFLAGLAELPLLAKAGLSAQHVAVSAQAGLVLPRITTLHVYDLGTERQLRSLPPVFPALRVLRLMLRPGYDPRKDSGLLTELFPGVSVRVAEAARRGNHE